MQNQEIAAFKDPKGVTVKLIKGDITGEQVDAIVNAANSHLQHGGGVAAAIVRKGGDVIQQESNKLGYVPVGEAAITGAGSLPARYVIHTVGPRWGEGDEDQKLQNAVTSSLQLASEYDLKSVSLPAISAGIFGFPVERCAGIIINTIRNFIRETSDNTLKEIRVCLYDQRTAEIFKTNFNKIFNHA